MKIRRLHIDRFGCLAGQKVEELAPGLNIFLGDNEAGKSTCRNFFRAMLFGYKRNNRNDALDYNASANSGRGQKSALSGGALWLDCGGQDSLIHLQRRPGKNSGALKLYNQQGRELPSGLLANLLGGVDVDLYDKVFAFDLEDLAYLASLSAREVSSALHAAAFGAGFRSPAEVLQSLDKSRKELFASSPNARTQAINKIVLRLNEIRQQIRENGSDIQRHAALTTEEAALHESLAQKRRLREALSLDWERSRSLAGAWESWQALQNCEAELELNPHPGGVFEADSLTRLEALCADLADKQSRLEGQEEELAQLEQQLEAERPAADLLRLAPLCRHLAAQREDAVLALKSIPQLQAEIEVLEQEQERLLGGLGGWSRSAALDFDISLAARQRVEDLRNSLQQADLAQKQAENDLERQQRESAQADLEEARLRQARAAAAAPVQNAQTGQTSAFAANSQADLSLFGPEMRQLIDLRARALEEAVQADQESGKERLRLEREAAALEKAAAVRAAEIAALARQTCHADDLHERQQDLGRLTRAAAEAASQVETARKLEFELAAARPRFFSFTSVRQDPRRAFPAVCCLALAALALYTPLTEIYKQAAAGLEPAAAQLPWASFGLGGLALWAGLFWISPRLASLGLYHPQPDPRQLRLLECLAKAGELHSAIRQLAGSLLDWLPDSQSGAGWQTGPDRQNSRDRQNGAGWPGEVFDPAALLAPLPAFSRRLEAFFKEQQQQLLRLQLLRLQEEQEGQRRSDLAMQLDTARKVESAAAATLQNQRRLWAETLRPYGLDAACPSGPALLIFDRAGQAAELRRNLAGAQNRLEEKKQQARSCRESWQAWLADTPFSPAATPPVVLEAFNLLEKCHARQADLLRHTARLQAQQAALDAFKIELGKLLAGLDISRVRLDTGLDTGLEAGLESGRESPVQVFDRLLDIAEAASRSEERRLQKEDERQTLQGRRSEGRARLAASQAALRRVLDLGGIAADCPLLQGAEEYRLRFARHRAHQTLALERDQLRRQLEQQAAARFSSSPARQPEDALQAQNTENAAESDAEDSPESGLENGFGSDPENGVEALSFPAGQKLWPGPALFFQALQATGREALAGRLADLQAQLEEVGREHETLLTRLGEIKASLAALAQGEGNSLLRREEAALREKLEDLSRRWAVFTLAHTFISRAKRSFETERQDKVVRQAGNFFQKLTLGRYHSLIFDLENRSLKAAAVPDPLVAALGCGQLDSETALSRGTREQLYLALRLAYIRQHNQSKRESLPLIMDDILVNFDPQRAAKAAELLAEFAAHNQIIFFTCHPHFDSLLSAAALGAAVPCARYRIDQGEITVQPDK